MLGIQTLHYLSRVSVFRHWRSPGILYLLQTEHFTVPAWFVWNWNYHLLSWCFLMVFFSSHSASWKSACDFVPSYSSCSSCGWGISLLSYQTIKSKVNWNTHFWQEKLFFRLSILYYKLNQVGYLTNTFHFAVGLFSYRPQMSNCGKKKKVALKLQPSVSECFKTVTRNPIVLYYKEVKCCS